MSVNISSGQIIVSGTLGSGSGYGIGKGYGMPTVTLNGGSIMTVASNAVATQVQLTTQGAYYCYNDNSAGAVNLAISSSNPSNPRIDVVIAQVEDAAYSGSNNDWKLAVVTGTAAASPTVPALPANAVVLAYVWVPAAATNIITADILDLRVAFNRNPFRAFAYRNGAWTTTTTAATMVWDTVVSNTDGGLATGTGLYTCPVSGIYLINANIRYTATATTNYANVYTIKNGAGLRFGPIIAAASTGATVASGLAVDIVAASAGDTLGVQTSFSTASLTGSTGQTTFVEITILSPQ
jgi:hypothetical protein